MAEFVDPRKDINIQNIFKDVFGITVNKRFGFELKEKPDDPLVFGNNIELTGKANSINQKYQGIEIVDNGEIEGMSYLNTPIIFPITFKAGVYQEFDRNGDLRSKTMSDFRLPLAAIASFRRPKIIGISRTASGHGTVKETFSLDDYQIEIKGFCLNDPRQPQGYKTALQQEAHMIEWDGLMSAIEVKGKLFDIRKIYNIVVKDIDFKQVRGNQGVRPFIITAISDEAKELIL